MKTWVKEKQKQLDDLYPKEKLTQRKERWRRLWRGERPLDRYPFVFAPATIRYYDDVFEPEQGLRAYLDEFLVHGQVEDDFIPAFSQGCRMGLMPGMFGAKEIMAGSDYTCERILTGYKDIDNLPEPIISPGSAAYNTLALQDYYMTETDGRIPIHVADMQGPLDVAAQLWGYSNLLAAPYEEPERYHRLLLRATAAFLLFWRKQQELLGSCFVNTHLFSWGWAPEEAGASLSADSMAMVSPQFYELYYKQYLEKIAMELGGLTVHSCGDFSAVVKNLCATKGVKAINSGQMSVRQLLDAGIDTDKVIISFEGADYAEKAFGQIREHNLRRDMTMCGIWPEPVASSGEWAKAQWRQIREIEGRVLEEASRI